MRGSSHHTKSSLRNERDAIRRAELRGGARLTARRRAYNDGVRRLRLRGGVGEKRKEPPSVDLFDAIKDGDVRAVREALDRGADPDEQNGETALYRAVTKDGDGDPGIVKILLERGADPNKRVGAYTPLHAIAEIPHEFYDLGTDPDDVSLIAQLLVKHGADVDAKVSPINQSGFHGASYGLVDHHDKTAMEIAQVKKNQPVIDVLKEAYKALAAKPMIRMLSNNNSLPGDGGPASLIAEYMYGAEPAREGARQFAAAEQRKEERCYKECGCFGGQVRD